MVKVFWRIASVFGFVLGSVFVVGCAVESSDVSSLDQSIVGGVEASEGAWPSVISISYTQSPAGNGQWCGGTLISSNRVLSAAHCFNDVTVSRYKVLVGRHDLDTSDGREISVTNILKHPSYAGLDYDLAILTLAESIDDVVPTRIVSPARMAEILDGDSATMLGWGALWEGGPSSPTLQQVSLGILGIGDDCEAVSAYSDEVTANEICIGRLDGMQDTCHGDSGGPAFVERDGEWFQLGATSWGYGCALPDYPGVYVFLPNLHQWIVDTVPGMSPSWLPSAQIMAVLQ